MFFGWNRVSRGFHLSATWLTAVGANLSALWILVANSWMQYPVGCTFNIDTVRNEMTSFWDVLLSPVAVNKFTHTVTSSFVLAALFVCAVCAWYLLRGREQKMARKSIAVASVFGLVFALITAFTGDRSGAIVARVQPMKLAALEALYDGEEGGSPDRSRHLEARSRTLEQRGCLLFQDRYSQNAVADEFPRRRRLRTGHQRPGERQPSIRHHADDRKDRTGPRSHRGTGAFQTGPRNRRRSDPRRDTGQIRSRHPPKEPSS